MTVETIETLGTTSTTDRASGPNPGPGSSPGSNPGPGYGTRHLIHRPTSWEHYLLDAPSSGEEHFVLAGSLPMGNPLSGGAPGHFHDPRYVFEELRDVGEFVGHRYFGVHGERPGVFSRLALALTDVPAWRAEGPEPPHVTTYLTARPEPAAAGRVPRGLAFGVDVRIGDVQCCTGDVELVFGAFEHVAARVPERLPERPPAHAPHRELAHVPAPHRERAGLDRREVRAPWGPDDATWGVGRPVAPAEVGRRSPGDVVVCEPVLPARARLTTWVLPPSDLTDPADRFDGADRSNWPDPSGPSDRPGPYDRSAPAVFEHGRLCGLMLEAVRQTSVLTAGRTRGYDADRALVTGWDVRFQGAAQPGLPLRCLAVGGPVDKDDDGRPSMSVALTMTQRRRVVAQARTRVVQDL